MKIYTRTGDDGTTGLGSRRRIDKDAVRIEAYGTVDELNSVLGVARAAGLASRLDGELESIQKSLFNLGADLCVPDEDKGSWPVPRVENEAIDRLERLMDELDQELAPLKNFIVPGGTLGAGQLHVARTVARRAERRLVSLGRTEALDPNAVRYLNRLSDALFVMARWQNHTSGVADTVWRSDG